MTSSQPPSLATIAARVDQLPRRRADGRAVERWATLDRRPRRAVRGDPPAWCCSGGKRLRPAFCHWGFVGAGGDPADERGRRRRRGVRAAARLRPVPRRRDGRLGQPPGRADHPRRVRRRRTARPTGPASRGASARAWPSSSATSPSCYADQLLPGAPPEAWQLWNELRIELNVGQYLDILGTAQGERSLAKAERIARYKSGKYTVERPLHLGALLAAPSAADELVPGAELLRAAARRRVPAARRRPRRVRRHGVTGKPVGDDLREGKPTPLLARAVARADAGRARRAGPRRRAGPHDDEVAAIQQVLVDTGALDELEAHIAALADEAVAALEPRRHRRAEARDELVRAGRASSSPGGPT